MAQAQMMISTYLLMSSLEHTPQEGKVDCMCRGLHRLKQVHHQLVLTEQTPGVQETPAEVEEPSLRNDSHLGGLLWYFW